MLSEAAEFFIGYCYADEKVTHSRPNFNEKYSRAKGEKEYKFTQEVLDEMVSSGRCVAKYQDKHAANLAGITGMSPFEKIEEDEE